MLNWIFTTTSINIYRRELLTSEYWHISRNEKFRAYRFSDLVGDLCIFDSFIHAVYYCFYIPPTLRFRRIYNPFKELNCLVSLSFVFLCPSEMWFEDIFVTFIVKQRIPCYMILMFLELIFMIANFNILFTEKIKIIYHVHVLQEIKFCSK